VETHSAGNLHTVAVKVAISFPSENLITRVIQKLESWKDQSGVFLHKCEWASHYGVPNLPGSPQ